ncbi:MAG: ribokinase [Solirubrobacterales bacterium]|nr:ribokinase [Solirubrobacterales bacterium]
MTVARPDNSGRRVVVVGAINVDLVVATDRLPGPGETVVGAGLERHGGGKGANAAVAAARAGAIVHLVGAVGGDDTGSGALNDLAEAGVNVDAVTVLPSESTGVALIVVDSDGENQIAVGAGANAALTGENVRQQMEGLLSRTDCVLVSTEISGEAVIAAVRATAEAGVTCILNSAPPIAAVLGLLQYGPLLTPNATELATLTAMLDADLTVEGRVGDRATDGYEDGAGEESTQSISQPIRDAARRLVDLTGSPIVVTLGANGAAVLRPDGEIQHFSPEAVEVRDTTGAGDTFSGVLAARLAFGDELGDAVRVATVAASLSVTQMGARGAMPQADQIEAALQAGSAEEAHDG